MSRGRASEPTTDLDKYLNGKLKDKEEREATGWKWKWERSEENLQSPISLLFPSLPFASFFFYSRSSTRSATLEGGSE